MFHKQKIGQAIILCGGFGKRLSEITNNKLHKSVVNIGGYPFIYYILSQIYFLRIRRVVLCTGILSASIEKEIDIFERKNPNIFDFIFSKETKPLGTAGALINSYPNLENEYSLVINGDTYIDDNLEKLFKPNFHNDILLFTSFKFFSNKYGAVVTNNKSELIGFNEKKISLFSYVNAGISIFKNKILYKSNIHYPINIEDLYYKDQNISIKVIRSFSKFIDIGTKKSFEKNNFFFSSLKQPFLY